MAQLDNFILYGSINHFRSYGVFKSFHITWCSIREATEHEYDKGVNKVTLYSNIPLSPRK